MGSFFSNAICFSEDIDRIKQFITDNKRNAFILSNPATPNHCLVTESVCDSLSIRENNQFLKPLSSVTEKPVFACIVHDSDDLLLCLFSNGNDDYELVKSLDFTETGELHFNGLEALSITFNVSEEELTKIHKNEVSDSYAFAEEYQKLIYSVLGLPEWSIGIGYNYLFDEDDLKLSLQNQGIKIEYIGN